MTKHPLMEDIAHVLITERQILSRIDAMADEIAADYRDKDLVLVGILKGAVVFFAELYKSLRMPAAIDFMAISSYGAATHSTGTVRVLKDLDISVEGKHVLIVEDIVDSGLTLQYLKTNMLARSVASVRVATLLDKPERRKVDIQPDYCGFTIPNEFVVGYGLDYNERYRNLREVCVLKPEIYTR